MQWQEPSGYHHWHKFRKGMKNYILTVLISSALISFILISGDVLIVQNADYNWSNLVALKQQFFSVFALFLGIVCMVNYFNAGRTIIHVTNNEIARSNAELNIEPDRLINFENIRRYHIDEINWLKWSFLNCVIYNHKGQHVELGLTLDNREELDQRLHELVDKNSQVDKKTN